MSLCGGPIRCVLIFLAFSLGPGTMSAATYHGVATKAEGALQRMEVMLIWEPSAEPTVIVRADAGKVVSHHGVVIAKIAVKFGEGGAFDDFDFFITQAPREGFSLIVYYINRRGNPVVVRFDHWAEGRPFWAYTPEFPRELYAGTFTDS